MSDKPKVEEEFDENNPPTDIGPIDLKNIPPRAPRQPKAERAPKKPQQPITEKVPQQPRAEKAPQQPRAEKAERKPMVLPAEKAESLEKAEQTEQNEKPEQTITLVNSAPSNLGSIMSLSETALTVPKKEICTEDNMISDIVEKLDNCVIVEKLDNAVVVKPDEKIESVNIEIKSFKSEDISSSPPQITVEMSANDSQTLYVKLLSPAATAPTRGSKFAAGYDLYSSEDITLQRNSRGLVSTGIALSIPVGYYGRVASRSSIASTKSVDVGAGVIDADYRGEVKVLLINNGNSAQSFAKGERIAQLILEKITTPDVVVVENLDDTDRGVGGFGSTGK